MSRFVSSLLLRQIIPVLCALTVAALAMPGPPIDRGDLAVGYARLDALMAKLPNDPVIRERANRCFDGLTADFFAGQYDTALAEIARLHGELQRLNDAGQLEQQFIYGHRFEPSERAVVRGEAATVTLNTLELQRMLMGAPPATLVAIADGVRIEVPYAEEAEFKIPAIAKPGWIDFRGEFKWSGSVSLARVAVLDKTLEDHRAAFGARIDALAKRGTITDAEAVSLRARCAILSDAPDRSRSQSLLADLPQLVRQLEEELSRAERGERPFAASGDVWRIYKALGTELPVRQFVPEGKGPFPLVVAFHGAGGDENMFFEAYGAGALLRSASGEGVVVVCPPTVAFGVSPNLLDALIEQLAKELPIDPKRVGLLGHSLGGVTASRLAVLKPNLITGAVCIAGFSDLARTGRPAPRKVFLAALDPIFPIESTTNSIQAAQMRGEQIEVETVPHEGHTFVVGRVVPQAIRWLLSRPARTSDAAKPTASAPSTTPMKEPVPNPSENVTSPSIGPKK